MTITAQLPDLLPDTGEESASSLAAQFLDLAGTDVIPGRDPGPAPGDRTAISMFTAHRLDGTLRELSHATQRMQAARDAPTGDLRAYHSRHVFYHLERALQAGHELTANIRAHYPAEAAELEQVKQAVGLAKSLTPGMKAATTAHLTETVLHEETHGVRHARPMTETEPGDVWEFNCDHAERHLAGALEHARKLTEHFADNYPDVAGLLDELEEITSRPEEGSGGKQHARYSKGTVSAQLANAETISEQADLSIACDLPLLCRRGARTLVHAIPATVNPCHATPRPALPCRTTSIGRREPRWTTASTKSSPAQKAAPREGAHGPRGSHLRKEAR